MSRLIDADDFKKFLQALCKAGAPYENVVQLLDKQPTAYDVEKVVAELEENSYTETVDDMDPYSDIPKKVVRLERTIDIVRKGGVE